MNKLEIKKLKITYKNSTLVDISFDVKSSLAIIGESGSGKSLSIKSLLNLLPSELNLEKEIISSFNYDKTNIGFVPQNPFTSLSPMTKIKNQFFCSKEKMLHSLELVSLDLDFINRYPMELSGGQLQRVVIAIALSNDPKLLLLDEPTTALDKETKIEIINLIKTISDKLNLKFIFVTHDIATIENLCNEILIMKKGLIVESGNTKEILNNPKNSYTIKLINSTFKNRGFRI